MFYKLKALHKQGCEIYLHCFEYGRGTAAVLEDFCKKVWYYKRNTGIGGISLTQPYIISSRNDATLLKRLQEIDVPILFDQVHSTYFLNHPSLAGRFKAIRIHNIEHDYFRMLAQKDNPFFKKTYFTIESILLKRYEHKLHAAQAFYALSAEDHEYFKKHYPNAQHTFIPPFHQHDEVISKEGSGDYCLYHGNLSHPENIEAALYLLTRVFPLVNMPVIIAGKKPASSIEVACKQLSNCTLIADPSKDKMDELVANAHIHVLPTFQRSGMKLKLLSSLYAGRHVIVNDAMLYGTGMPGEICHVANNESEFAAIINRLQNTPFTLAEINRRTELLAPYDNAVNAKKLLGSIKF